MKKTTTMILSLFLFCMASSSFSEEKSKEPTLITSDGPLDADFANKIAIFKDNVVVTNPDGVLKADHMKVYFTKGSNQIEKIHCTGNVVIHQTERHSESDEAVYYVFEKKIVLTGDPVIKQDNDHYRGEVITIFTEDNRVVFEPSAQLLIYPNDSSENNMTF